MHNYAAVEKLERWELSLLQTLLSRSAACFMAVKSCWSVSVPVTSGWRTFQTDECSNRWCTVAQQLRWLCDLTNDGWGQRLGKIFVLIESLRFYMIFFLRLCLSAYSAPSFLQLLSLPLFLLACLSVTFCPSLASSFWHLYGVHADISISLLAVVVGFCGLALLVVSLFVFWKLCWPIWRSKALSAHVENGLRVGFPEALPSNSLSAADCKAGEVEKKYPLEAKVNGRNSVKLQEAAMKISQTSPDIPAEVQTALREKLKQQAKIQRQTTEPTSSSRYSTWTHCRHKHSHHWGHVITAINTLEIWSAKHWEDKGLLCVSSLQARAVIAQNWCFQGCKSAPAVHGTMAAAREVWHAWRTGCWPWNTVARAKSPTRPYQGWKKPHILEAPQPGLPYTSLRHSQPYNLLYIWLKLLRHQREAAPVINQAALAPFCFAALCRFYNIHN